MPDGHRHLTRDERCRIGALKESGLSDGAVAARLGRDRTSVWRELRRNGGGGYSPGEAQGRVKARRSAASGVPRKMTPDRWAQVEGRLAEGRIRGARRAGNPAFLPFPPLGLRPRCGNGRCCTSEWKWGN